MRFLAIFFGFVLTGCASTQVTDIELIVMGKAQFENDYAMIRIASRGFVPDVLAISFGELKGRFPRAEPLLRDMVRVKHNGISKVIVGGNNPSLTARILRDAFAIAKPGILEGVNVMVVAGEEYRDMIAAEAEQAGAKLTFAPIKS